MTHIEQTADAILALINSKPRTPTRDEIESALANFRPDACNDNRPDYPSPLPPLRMRPSELGWGLIETLMPAYIDALRYSSTSETGSPGEAEFEAATQEAYDALWGRSFEASNLVDLAIAWRISVDGETPQEVLAAAKANWERYDRHEGYEEPGEYDGPDSMRGCMDSSDILAYKLVSAILSMAGIDEARCSCSGLSKARGLHVTPTPAERQEALARLRGGHTNNGRLLRALLA